MKTPTIEKHVIGLIINPISGMGGSVGLKGTDGNKILERAIKLGAKPNAQNRTKELLEELTSIRHKLHFITCSGKMGEEVLKKMGFSCEIINHPLFNSNDEIHGTSAEHTKKAAEMMKEMNDLKLILFIGGDGTARDVLNAVNKEKACLGIPAGVKIYSSVFSITPKIAASLIMQFLWEEAPLKESEVLDIDEQAYREGKLVAKLYGYMITPFNPEISQPSKLGTPDSDLNNQERIAKYVVENLENDVYYLVGPGTTTKAITDALRQPKSVLGVDLLFNGQVIAQDLNETGILEHVEGKETKIIVSLIGRQGFLFGRGNLQFTPRVLEGIGMKNIIIISTKYKLQNIPGQTLKIDTRDPSLDEKMRGLYKVITDYDQLVICEVI